MQVIPSSWLAVRTTLNPEFWLEVAEEILQKRAELNRALDPAMVSLDEVKAACLAVEKSNTVKMSQAKALRAKAALLLIEARKLEGGRRR